ncbi:MAG TPA: PadR family transcriptional regulator [Candidatus Elarobacter sp.]|jgi:DNA-binding PadR family transcriptional regulator
MMHDIGRAFFRHRQGGGRGGPRIWGLGYSKEWGGWKAGGWSARTRRGDVKFLVLELLAEGPRHGYDIIKGIEERRGVRPSAGSVYPTLQLLEDGGFVTSEQVDGKRIYTITDAGRALLANRAADPDEDEDADEAPNVRHKLRESVMKFVAAVWNARHTDDATLEKVREIVDKARKDVYTILASDDT